MNSIRDLLSRDAGRKDPHRERLGPHQAGNQERRLPGVERRILHGQSPVRLRQSSLGFARGRPGGIGSLRYGRLRRRDAAPSCPAPPPGSPSNSRPPALEIIGEAPSDSYPLQKKNHSLEFLREIAHLSARTNTFGAVARVRNQMAFAVHTFFQDRGFQYVHTPIITASDCEGAGAMFQVTTLDLDALAKSGRPRRLLEGLLRQESLPVPSPASSTWRPTAWPSERSTPSAPPSARRIPTRPATWPSSG